MSRPLGVALFGVALGLMGADSDAADASEDLAVIVNPSVGVQSLDPDRLRLIFTGGMQNWPDGKPIRPFNYPPETALRVRFDKLVLRMNPFEAGRFWVDQRVRGQSHPPREIGETTLMKRLVSNLPGAIAYVPASVVDGSVRVVARLRGDKVTGP